MAGSVLSSDVGMVGGGGAIGGVDWGAMDSSGSWDSESGSDSGGESDRRAARIGSSVPLWYRWRAWEAQGRHRLVKSMVALDGSIGCTSLALVGVVAGVPPIVGVIVIVLGCIIVGGWSRCRCLGLCHCRWAESLSLSLSVSASLSV